MESVDHSTPKIVFKRLGIFFLGLIWASLFWLADTAKYDRTYTEISGVLQNDARISNTFNPKYSYMRFEIECNEASSRKIEIDAAMSTDNVAKFNYLLLKGAKVECHVESKYQNNCSRTVEAYSLRINGKDYYTLADYLSETPEEKKYSYIFLFLGAGVMIYSIGYKIFSKYEERIINIGLTVITLICIVLYIKFLQSG